MTNELLVQFIDEGEEGKWMVKEEGCGWVEVKNEPTDKFAYLFYPQPSVRRERKPSKPPTKVLSCDVVKSIRERISNGESQASIARELNVSSYVINNIHKRRTYTFCK